MQYSARDELASNSEMGKRLVPNDARLRVELGRVIRDRRLELEMSQEALGQLTLTDRTRVSKVESGEFNLTLRILVRFASAIQLSTSDLFRFAEARIATRRNNRVDGTQGRVI